MTATPNKLRNEVPPIDQPEQMTVDVELENGVQANFIYEKGGSIQPAIDRLVDEHRSPVKSKSRAKAVTNG